MSEFRIGLYKHFKGNIYRVIGIATHTETGECLVLYKNAHHSGLTWARPFEMFMEKVDGKPRFEFIEAEFPNSSNLQPTCNQLATDTISRKAAIDAVNSHFGFSVEEEYGSAVREVLKALPPAQPEQKTGKWILTEDDNYEYCTCSECGYQNGENWMNGSDIPFCANCGADMRGEQYE